MPISGKKSTNEQFDNLNLTQQPETKSVSTAFSKDSFRKSVAEAINQRCLFFDAPKIDQKIKITTGITLMYGDTNTGKTNTCLHIAFKALDKGMKVIHYDLEDGIDPERLLQIYRSYSWSFPIEKVYSSFVKPDRLEWNDIMNDLSRIINIEKPHVLILDAFTPLFMKEFNKIQKNKWDVANKRESVVYDLLDSAHNNNMIVIVVAHAKARREKKKDDFDKQLQTLASEPNLFAGLGTRFEFLGKMWIYFMKVIDEKGNMHRYMIVTKQKVGKDFYESKEKIEFDITDKGIQ